MSYHLFLCWKRPISLQPCHVHLLLSVKVCVHRIHTSYTFWQCHSCRFLQDEGSNCPFLICITWGQAVLGKWRNVHLKWRQIQHMWGLFLTSAVFRNTFPVNYCHKRRFPNGLHCWTDLKSLVCLLSTSHNTYVAYSTGSHLPPSKD